MEHRGEIVKEKLKEFGLKIKFVADLVNHNEIYFYKLLDKSDLSWAKIKQIGRAINYDFSNDFPDMPSFDESVQPEDAKLFEGENDKLLNREAQKWKKKYLDLMEDFTELLREKKTADKLFA